jgi:serine/threonine-protein phosphatase 5
MSDQSSQDQIIELPSLITPEWIAQAQAVIEKSTWNGANALQEVLPKQTLISILQRTERLVFQEAALVDVTPCTPATSVVVVGDTHGQFHDACRMFEIAGTPSEERIYIFNGDFVDRGAWGIETLALFCLWKLALPNRVFLLRGNHETVTCAFLYGFKGELEAKYGKAGHKNVFAACKKLFAVLPLSALINKQTLVLHGGLFRKQPSRGTGKNKRKLDECVVGSLDDLRKASKGGLDPDGSGASRLAADVQWSDPTTTPGFLENHTRGIGMTFGPEITEKFLRDNKLKLILRSHEGPDARDDREDMGNMLEGYTEDHVTPAGRLLTIFSAPDYPQFMADGVDRYKNKAAVAVLSAPNYDTPAMTQYEAALPRPQATPYYDLYVNDSDEELEVVPSTLSGMTDVREERAKARGEREAAGEEEEGGEVVSKVAEEEKVKPAKKQAVSLSPKKAATPTSPKASTATLSHGGGADTPRANSRGSSPTKWHAHPRV